MRPVTRQALVLVGLVPLGVGVLGVVGHPAGRWFWSGLGAAGLFIVVAYARSINFESKHLGESREFWRDREAVVRPRFFFGSVAALLCGGLAIVIAVVHGSHGPAEFLAVPVLLAGSFVLLLWGKVP